MLRRQFEKNIKRNNFGQNTSKVKCEKRFYEKTMWEENGREDTFDETMLENIFPD